MPSSTDPTPRDRRAVTAPDGRYGQHAQHAQGAQHGRHGQHGRTWPAVVVAVVAAAGVVATWWVFVATRTGQLVDEAAIDGAVYGRSRLWLLAEPVLDIVSIPVLGAVLAVSTLLALVRRRPHLVVQVVLMVGGANVTTQLLKHVLLPRPELDVGGRAFNTLPSGHTTAAASIAAPLLLVAPRGWRVPVALLGAVYTGATGVSTLIGGWHRPSDVVAGVLVVVAWAAAAVAAVRTWGEVPVPARDRGTPAAVATLSVGAGGAGTLAVLALLATVDGVDAGGALTARTDLLTAYGGGALGVVAVTCAGWAALLWVLRAAEPRPAGAPAP